MTPTEPVMPYSGDDLYSVNAYQNGFNECLRLMQPLIEECRKALAKELIVAVVCGRKLDALAADNLALREALENLIGDPTDPNIGWRGRSSAIDMFACEHCLAEHLDCTMIPHAAECPVPPAIALARTPAKENNDG